ncbi:MAG: hypothetical protein A3J38_02700 [Gammaproteobacteria bacterium RIFCSPHIGHO2_12_FULL_45_9]|nr:MAG: hypothetical protein A3J38_02700 [Gammaproteobacteria bacterium RIFCSPHIGHO2_12_FULL_45_9]
MLSFRRCVGLMVGFVLGVILLCILLGNFAPSTNNAYVQAYVAQVSPQVSGRVVKIFVQNDQPVKKGQPLFQLDDRLYRQAVQQATADLRDARNQVATLQQSIQVALQKIDESKADLDYAKTHYLALKSLSGLAVSKLDVLQAKSHLQVLTSQLAAALLEYRKAKDTLGDCASGECAIVTAAKAKLKTAQIEYDETLVHAPDDGYVTNMSLNAGTYADAGTAILTFIANKEWWIVANVSENNLHRVQPGQVTEITLYDHPGVILKGRVESIGHGVNLSPEADGVNLPYIEKTNSWTETAQRFPVRIRLLAPHDISAALRIGATCYVTIYTDHTGVVHRLAALLHRIVSVWAYI